MPYDLWQVVHCYKESRKIAIIQKFMKHLKGKMAKNEVCICTNSDVIRSKLLYHTVGCVENELENCVCNK